MVLALLEKETLDKEEIAKIFKKIKKRNNRPAWTGSSMRIPSQLPPVDVPARIESAPEEVKKRTTRSKKSDE
jgi:cell division protease FtsH